MKKHYYILVFFLLSLVVMWDLLKPGYVFSIDMVFGPHYPRVMFQHHVLGMGANLGNVGPTHIATIFFTSITYLLSAVFPAWLIQKLIFVVILTLSGIAMYRLVPIENAYARYFAGFLYMINPFIYVRILSGSSFFLLSYALLPFAVKSFIDLFNKPTLKNTIWAGLWLTLICLSEHFLPMALGIFLLFYIVNLFQKKERTRQTAAFFGAIAIFSAINASWIYSLISGEAAVVQGISQITSEDLYLFPTDKGSNVLLNVTTLYGYWRSGYYDPRLHLILDWRIIFSFIIFLVMNGLVGGFSEKSGLYIKAMGIIAIISILLAIGTSSPYLSGAYYFLYENVPLLKGMREPQKFAALLVLAYAYLGGIGLVYIKESMAKFKFKAKILSAIVAVLMLLLPLGYTYSMFFGLHGQLNNTDYPQDYYQVDAFLNQDKDEFNILFLPWHAFMNFSWIGGNVANPANIFFNKPVIQGDNIEIGEIFTQSVNPVSKYIEAILDKRETISNVGEFLTPLKVKYVILAKETDYEAYLFLEKQMDLEMVKDTPNLQLFVNRSYTDISIPIKETAEFLGLEDKTTRALEENIALYEKKHTIWIGYLFSSILFLGCLGYLYLPGSYLKGKKIRKVFRLFFTTKTKNKDLDL